MTNATLNVADALVGHWNGLLGCGPRVHGTPGADAAVTFIRRRLGMAGLASRLQSFPVPGWKPNGEATVAVTAPESLSFPAHTMLLSRGTPGGSPVSGRVSDMGRLDLWGGQHVWRRFAVHADGAPLAYLCGRPNGPAIPQLLPAGASPVPHVVIGADDTRRLDGWLTSGREVSVVVDSPAEQGPVVEGHNIHAVVPGDGAGRVVLMAHYDSVWSSPGAYDNASGVAVVLEVAARLAADPLPVTVDVLLTGGEELGLLGGAAFVSALEPRESEDIAFVLNVEGMGRGTLLDLWAGPEDFEWTVADAIRRHPRSRNLEVRSTFPPLRGSDHAPFHAAGLPVAMLTFDDQEVLHSAHDVANDGVLANMRLGVELVEHVLRTVSPGASA